LVPFENDYLFKKWGINSIFMDNFITYEYNSVIPSDLSSKTILMIGRADDKLKRFKLGVEAMVNIIKEIPQCKMKIISDLNSIDYLKDLINILKLGNNIEFVGYTPNPEIYYKNASLHIFPSISESFGLALSETKIFGIPSILVGLDYLSISKGGMIIIYDDNSGTISKEAIKILKNEKYRKKLGKEARRSMKKFKNKLLLKKWIKLILSIYNGYNYYEKLREEEQKISDLEANNILINQIKLLKKRISNFKNITLQDIENFTYMENLK
jgi:glycosyltransferase involved in cell wall biosynthesis